MDIKYSRNIISQKKILVSQTFKSNFFYALPYYLSVLLYFKYYFLALDEVVEPANE